MNKNLIVKFRIPVLHNQPFMLHWFIILSSVMNVCCKKWKSMILLDSRED